MHRHLHFLLCVIGGGLQGAATGFIAMVSLGCFGTDIDRIILLIVFLMGVVSGFVLFPYELMICCRLFKSMLESQSSPDKEQRRG